MRLFFKRYMLPVILAFLAANIIFFFIKVPHTRSIFSPEYWRSMSLVGDVFRLVHTHYVDEDLVDYEVITDAALSGMMESLDDFSSYMGQAEYKNFSERTNQSYVGIGVEIERVDDRITIVSAFPGGASAEAGMVPGDQIIAVEGNDTRNATLTEMVAVLEGEDGSSVKVEVYRPSESQTLQFLLIRGDVKLQTVLDIRTVDEVNNIQYLRITNFGENTATEFRRALDDLESAGMKALVIDLRNNPGGLLQSAIAFSSEFFVKGELIVSTRGRTEKEYREFFSQTASRIRKFPIAIVINGESASASEIVAGVMQDTRRAVIVGQRSLGKGSVQSVYGLSQGRGLRQTTAMYFMPSGRTINKVGVEPDVPIVISDEESAQLVIQRRHTPYLSEEKFIEIFGFEPLEDRQLTAAIDVLKAALAADAFLKQ